MVLDASACVEWLLGLPDADRVAAHLADVDVHAPHLLPVEVAQVVRRHVRAGAITADRGHQALADLADLEVTYHDHVPLLPQMWRWRENLTAYDAAYVVLADLLDAPLLTFDARLAGAPGHTARIHLLP